jgi:plasmid maintenance system antidote protein VapI
MSQSRKKGDAMARTLREMIRASGETVTAISRETGIAQPVLHRFVTGERDLTLRTADKLIGYFGLELRPRDRGKAGH